MRGSFCSAKGLSEAAHFSSGRPRIAMLMQPLLSTYGPHAAAYSGECFESLPADPSGKR